MPNDFGFSLSDNSNPQVVGSGSGSTNPKQKFRNTGRANQDSVAMKSDRIREEMNRELNRASGRANLRQSVGKGELSSLGYSPDESNRIRNNRKIPPSYDFDGFPNQSDLDSLSADLEIDEAFNGDNFNQDFDDFQPQPKRASSKQGSRKPGKGYDARKNPELEIDLDEIDLDMEDATSKSKKKKPSPKKAKAKKEPEIEIEDEVDDYTDNVDEEEVTRARYSSGDEYLENSVRERDSLASQLGQKSGKVRIVIMIAAVVVSILFILIGGTSKTEEAPKFEAAYEEFSGSVAIDPVVYYDTFLIEEKLLRKEGTSVSCCLRGTANNFGKSIIFDTNTVIYEKVNKGDTVHITYSITRMLDSKSGASVDCVTNVKVIVKPID